MRTKRIALLLLAISLPGWIPAVVFGNDTADIAAPSPPETKEDVAWSSPIGLFRKFISPADGDRCPMYPTCSHYAQQALSQKGVLVGWVLASDRLLRCGRDETRIAPIVRIQGINYTYDPLDANTFWWKRR